MKLLKFITFPLIILASQGSSATFSHSVTLFPGNGFGNQVTENCFAQSVANSADEINGACAGGVQWAQGGSAQFASSFRAEAGNLGVAASSSTSPTPLVGNVIRFTSDVSYQDTLTFGINSGSVEFDLALTGKTSIFGESNFSSAGYSGFVNNFLGGESFGLTQTNAVGTLVFGGGFTSRTVSLQFNNGSMVLGAGLSTTVECGSQGDLPCITFANAFDSMKFVGARVYDDAGGLVNTTISSSSGFDYITGFIEPSGPAVVPIPSSALLFISAFLGLGYLQRKNKRAPT